MSTHFPGAGFLLCPNGGALAMFDDQATSMSGLIKWLRGTE